MVMDYVQRRINGEHGLQSSLYFHLRRLLRPNFRVFPEAVVLLGQTGQDDLSKNRVVIDLLVELQGEVVGAVEIKFTPRGEARDLDIQKDLTSLAFLTNRRASSDRVVIDMPRYRGKDPEQFRLGILPQRKLIFAAYCQDDASYAAEANFWKHPRRPTTGYWRDRMSMPKHLGVALAITSDTDPKPIFFGRPLDDSRV